MDESLLKGEVGGSQLSGMSLWRSVWYLCNAFDNLLMSVIFWIRNLYNRWRFNLCTVHTPINCKVFYVCVCVCVRTAGRPFMRSPDGGWRKPSFNPSARILYPPSHTRTAPHWVCPLFFNVALSTLHYVSLSSAPLCWYIRTDTLLNTNLLKIIIWCVKAMSDVSIFY